MFCGKKVIVCLKGVKGAPLKSLKLFFPAKFFLSFNIHKNAFHTNSKLFSQPYGGNKKERNYLPQDLQIVVFQHSFSQYW